MRIVSPANRKDKWFRYNRDPGDFCNQGKKIIPIDLENHTSCEWDDFEDYYMRHGLIFAGREMEKFAGKHDTSVILKISLGKNSTYSEELTLPFSEPIDFHVRRPTQWDFFIWDLQYKLSELNYYLRHNYLLLAGFFVLILLPTILHIRKNSPLRPFLPDSSNNGMQ